MDELQSHFRTCPKHGEYFVASPDSPCPFCIKNIEDYKIVESLQATIYRVQNIQEDLIAARANADELVKRNLDYLSQIDELKARLAEKDKEIEAMNGEVEICRKAVRTSRDHYRRNQEHHLGDAHKIYELQLTVRGLEMTIEANHAALDAMAKVSKDNIRRAITYRNRALALRKKIAIDRKGGDK